MVMASLTLRKVAPISDSDSEDVTVLIRWHRVCMAPLLVGRVGGLLPFLASWSARENGRRIGCVCVLQKDRMYFWRHG